MKHETITRWHGPRLITQRIPVALGSRSVRDEPKLRWYGNELELDRPIELTRRKQPKPEPLLKAVAWAILSAVPVTMVMAVMFGVMTAMALEVMR